MPTKGKRHYTTDHTTEEQQENKRKKERGDASGADMRIHAPAGRLSKQISDRISVGRKIV